MNRRTARQQSLALAGIFLIGGLFGPIAHWINHASQSEQRLKCDHEVPGSVHLELATGLEEEVCLQCVRVPVLYADYSSIVHASAVAKPALFAGWGIPDRIQRSFERSRAPPALPS